MSVKPQRQMHLESVRGLAALAVVLAHLMLAFYPHMRNPNPAIRAGTPAGLKFLTYPPLNVVYSGSFAVVVFFVLSGFVLSYSYFRCDGADRRSAVLASAAVRRYFRLVLPILFSVAVAYALLRLGALYHRQLASVVHAEPGRVVTDDDWWFGAQWNFPPTLGSALKEGLFGVFFSFDPARTYNTVLWTMSVELAGSFFVYSFLALFGALRNRWVIYTALGAGLLALTSYHMLAFLAGIAVSDACARLERAGPGAASSRLGRVGLLLCLGGLAAGATWWDDLLPFHVPARPTAVLGAAMLIAGCAVSPLARRLLNRGPFVFLGKVSFAMYLLHLLVLFSVAAWAYLRLRGWGCGHHAGAAAASVTCVAVTLAVSWLAYRLVDVPAIELGRLVYGRIFAPAPAAAPAPALPPAAGSIPPEQQPVALPAARDAEAFAVARSRS